MEWRTIPGFPSYEVSDTGLVRSIPRPGTRGGPMVVRVGTKGYLQVRLSEGGKTSTIRLHVLVAATFLGPRPAGLQVRHRDGKKMDCSAGNLVYGTNSQNQLDSVEHGTHGWSSRDSCSNGHPFTPENTLRWASHGNGRARVCRTCRADYKRKARASA